MSEADTNDVVAELDKWLAWAPDGLEIHAMARRARDEIVALRMRYVADTPIRDLMKQARAKALEEAAQIAEYLTNSVCAGRIRALKDKS
jgi:hypothetical protein